MRKERGKEGELGRRRLRRQCNPEKVSARPVGTAEQRLPSKRDQSWTRNGPAVALPLNSVIGWDLHGNSVGSA